jgi:hypothetical protein
MSLRNKHKPTAPWVELITTNSDWDAADPGLLKNTYSNLQLLD